MSRPIPMYRKLWLTGEVTEASVQAIVDKIMEINKDDDEKRKDYSDWVSEPIWLFINTFGGVCYDSFGLVDIMQASRAPVYTVAIGKCMSSGLLIYIGGKQRFTGPNTTFMFHDVSFGKAGKTEEVKQELEEAKRIGSRYCNFIKERTNITQEMMDSYIKTKAEWYIPAEEAIGLGIS